MDWIGWVLVLAAGAYLMTKATPANAPGVPRGIRNNNPGNIKYNGTQWQGLANPPTDGTYARFDTALYGLRAIAVIMKTYRDVHGLNTVRGIITRWAPPGSNNTEAYIKDVSQRMGVTPDQPLDPGVSTQANLVKAIVMHENGQQPYNQSLINNAVQLA